MAPSLLDSWAEIRRPIIGMVHLPALPGSPGCNRPWQAVLDAAAADVQALVEGGVDGLMLENYGDVPFFADQVPTETVAMMTAAACHVRRLTDLPLGINVLRNDGFAALAVACACGASFIRVNVLSGAMLTDQGLIQGQAAKLLRYRRQLGVEHVRILADIRVKHAIPLAERPLAEEVDDLIERACADGLVVTGPGTGKAVDTSFLADIYNYAKSRVPVLAGSGVTCDNVKPLGDYSDGYIVGSSFKRDGCVSHPVIASEVRRFVTNCHT